MAHRVCVGVSRTEDHVGARRSDMAYRGSAGPLLSLPCGRRRTARFTEPQAVPRSQVAYLRLKEGAEVR